MSFEINDHMHPMQRGFFLLVGLVCLCLPAWDLRHAFLEPGWWTLFFALIVLGAAAIGSVMILGAVAGESAVWNFDNGVLALHRRSPIGQRTTVVRAKDVQSIDIETVEWDSRANTYRPVLILKSGERLRAPDHGRKEDADCMAKRMAEEFGL